MANYGRHHASVRRVSTAQAGQDAPKRYSFASAFGWFLLCIAGNLLQNVVLVALLVLLAPSIRAWLERKKSTPVDDGIHRLYSGFAVGCDLLASRVRGFRADLRDEEQDLIAVRLTSVEVLTTVEQAQVRSEAVVWRLQEMWQWGSQLAARASRKEAHHRDPSVMALERPESEAAMQQAGPVIQSVSEMNVDTAKEVAEARAIQQKNLYRERRMLEVRNKIEALEAQVRQLGLAQQELTRSLATDLEHIEELTNRARSKCGAAGGWIEDVGYEKLR